jgi:hypothetical protein
MNTSAAVLIGSAISAIVALAVVGFQHSLERRRQFNAERAERLGDFLASTFAVSTRIEQVATAPTATKARAEEGIRSAVEDQLNRSLTRLRLFEDSEVVMAATYLERELTLMTIRARGRVWSRAEWRAQREEIALLTDNYERVARRQLGRLSLEHGLGFYAAETESLPRSS